jgi:hypothetical protein
MAAPLHGAPLSVSARVAALGLALAAATSCSRDPPAAAPAAALPARDEWRVECRPVKDDRYQACYGPGWEARRPREPAHFHFYQVSVERKQASDSAHVLFVKRLGIADVDAKLLQDAYPGEVARYDPATRSVRFDVAREPIVFPLDAVR